MKMIIKAILFPISFSLTIIVSLFTFLIKHVAVLLNIISGITFFAALVNLVRYLFGWPYAQAGSSHSLSIAISAAVVAFILSPYGLPTVAIWLLSKLDGLNNAIKDI